MDCLSKISAQPATSHEDSDVASGSESLSSSRSLNFPPTKSTSNAQVTQRWWQNVHQKASSAELRSMFMSEYQVGSFASHLVGGNKTKFQQLTEPMTIALFGPPGAGKSSFVNSLVRVVEDEVPFLTIAGVNDMEPGRSVRTRATHNYLIGRTRNRQMGAVELWDVRGNWHIGNAHKDVAIIQELLHGVTGVGDVCLPQEEKSLFQNEVIPVGGCVRRPVQLILFVISATTDPQEVTHLQEILQVMHENDYPYAVILTRCEDTFGSDWDNGALSVKPTKLPTIPQSDILFCENYTTSKSIRNEKQDKNIMLALMKLLIKAERSLLSKQRLSRNYHVITSFAGQKKLFVVMAFIVVLALTVAFYFTSFGGSKSTAASTASTTAATTAVRN